MLTFLAHTDEHKTTPSHTKPTKYDTQPIFKNIKTPAFEFSVIIDLFLNS